MKKFIFIILFVVSPFCYSQKSFDSLTLTCSGKETGYKIYLKDGKKTTFEKNISDETYEIVNGVLRDNMKCEFTNSSIWCHDKGEGVVLVNSYLIWNYSIEIDRYSGKIRDYSKEIMTHNGVKTELVNDFVGKCNKVTKKKF